METVLGWQKEFFRIFITALLNSQYISLIIIHRQGIVGSQMDLNVFFNSLYVYEELNGEVVCKPLLGWLVANDLSKLSIAKCIRKNQKPTSVIVLFNEIIAQAPQALLPLITAVNYDNAHIGEYIAQHCDAQTLGRFFDIVIKHTSQIVPWLLTTKTPRGWHIGHSIARSQDSYALDNFYSMILSYCPASMPDILNRMGCGQHLGHLIAEHQDHRAVINFFTLVLQQAPETLPGLLTSAEESSVFNMGHLIARHQKLETLEYFFRLIEVHIPAAIPAILKARSNHDWHLGHYIVDSIYHNKKWDRRGTDALLTYLKLAITYTKDDLPELLDVKNKDQYSIPCQNMIETILYEKDSYTLGAVIFLLITSNISLKNPKMSDVFKSHKMDVLEYIKGLPAEVQDRVLEDTFDRTTLLGKYFSLQLDCIHRLMPANRHLLHEIKKMKNEIRLSMEQTQWAEEHKDNFQSNPEKSNKPELPEVVTSTKENIQSQQSFFKHPKERMHTVPGSEDDPLNTALEALERAVGSICYPDMNNSPFPDPVGVI
jgi:predicted nucleic-acid-binding Zn-ribbon protein